MNFEDFSTDYRQQMRANHELPAFLVGSAATGSQAGEKLVANGRRWAYNAKDVRVPAGRSVYHQARATFLSEIRKWPALRQRRC